MERNIPTYSSVLRINWAHFGYSLSWGKKWNRLSYHDCSKIDNFSPLMHTKRKDYHFFPQSHSESLLASVLLFKIYYILGKFESTLLISCKPNYICKTAQGPYSTFQQSIQPAEC